MDRLFLQNINYFTVFCFIVCYLAKTSVVNPLNLSTRITLAPKSDSIMPANGAGASPAISKTQIFESGRDILVR